MSQGSSSRSDSDACDNGPVSDRNQNIRRPLAATTLPPPAQNVRIGSKAATQGPRNKPRACLGKRGPTREDIACLDLRTQPPLSARLFLLRGRFCFMPSLWPWPSTCRSTSPKASSTRSTSDLPSLLLLGRTLLIRVPFALCHSVRASGGVPDWLIGTVLKTVDRFRLSVGSNPTPSASTTKGNHPDRPSQPAC